jgi:hypothetical protein
MISGRLRLANGFSASCSYDLSSDGGGRLSLPSSLYLPRREREEATLCLDGGSERAVMVTFHDTLGAATFAFAD